MTDQHDEVNGDDLLDFANNRDRLDPELARSALENSLAALRYNRLAGPEATTRPRRSIPQFTELVVYMFWAIGVTAAGVSGVSFWWSPLFAFGLFICTGIVGAIDEGRFSDAFATFLFLGTLLGLIYGAFENRSVLLIGYAIPAAVATVLALALRRLLSNVRDVATSMGALASGVPLVAPLVLIFLFFPVISQETWQIATVIGVLRFGAIALLSVGAMYLVVLRKLRTELESVAATRIVSLTAKPDRAALTRRSVAAALGEKSEEAEKLETVRDETLDQCWPARADEYSGLLATLERRALLSPLKFRVALTTVAVFAVIAVYVYLVAIAAVPMPTASKWSGSTATSSEVFSVEVPWDPYFLVAILLGIVGTAGFLAFTVVEDRFATAMTTALLRRPLDRFLTLGIPLLNLREATSQTSASPAE